MNIALGLDTRPITRIYRGQDNVCRCGCKGKYHEPNTPGFKMALAFAQNALLSGNAQVTDTADSYINISYGNDRAVCIYFD